MFTEREQGIMGMMDEAEILSLFTFSELRCWLTLYSFVAPLWQGRTSFSAKCSQGLLSLRTFVPFIEIL